MLFYYTNNFKNLQQRFKFYKNVAHDFKVKVTSQIFQKMSNERTFEWFIAKNLLIDQKTSEENEDSNKNQ